MHARLCEERGGDAREGEGTRSPDPTDVLFSDASFHQTCDSATCTFTCPVGRSLVRSLPRERQTDRKGKKMREISREKMTRCAEGTYLRIAECSWRDPFPFFFFLRQKQTGTRRGRGSRCW